MDLVILLGAVQGFIFSIYLLVKPLKNKKASTFLAIFILAFAANSIYYTLETIGVRGHWNAWDFSPFYCPLLIMVSFYYFIRFLVWPDSKLNVWNKLLFLPVGFQIGFQFWGFVSIFVNRSIVLENQFLIYKIYDLFDIITLILGVLLLVLSVIMIRAYDKKLQNNYGEIGDFSLRWLSHIVFFLLGIWILFAIPNIYELITGNTSMNMYYPLWIASSVLIYWIGYSTYFRRRTINPELFDLKTKDDEPKLSLNTQKYHTELLSIMDSDKLYLDQDLNLKMLSDKLNLSSGYLSQIINQYEGKNFFEFVNSYRVESVKEKIADPEYDRLNMLGIAYDSGFKSKSTFNLVFKKLTGMTPSAYKKSKITN